MHSPGDTGRKTMTNATSKTRHVRIEGDGTSPGTRIIDTSTGEAISRVQGYTVTQRVGQVAKAVIEVALPQVSLECDAGVRELPAAPRDCGAAPAPSVQPADVEAQITHTFYANLGDAENAAWPDPNARDEFHPALNMITTCTLVTKNGHSVVGVAYCADPAKFNAQTGRDAARADAIRQLWPMVIYAERERLAAPPSIQLTPAEVQSGVDRVRWAELLIEQLPADHEGRNSWLLNFGTAAPDLRPAASDDDF